MDKEKFTKFRDGDFWVLDTETEEGTISEGVLITKEVHDEITCVQMYLWGADGNKFTENNPYRTPRDFLVSIVKQNFNNGSSPLGIRELARLKYIGQPTPSMGMYEVTVNKGTIKEQNVLGATESKAIENGLEYLPSSILITIINNETQDYVVPVYCQEDNPKDLTTNGNYGDVLQIGYALVNKIKMHDETFYLLPEDAVEDFIYNEQGNPDEYGFEYYIWDEVEQEWQFEESGEGFVGDDPKTNGFFEENGYEWENARLDEYWIEEEAESKNMVQDEEDGETIASMFEDEDDDIDWDDDDFEDWDEDDIWISG